MSSEPDDESVTLGELADTLADARTIIGSLSGLILGAAAVLTWLVVITNTPSTADRALTIAQENREVLVDIGYSIRVVLCESDDGSQLSDRGRRILNCDRLGESRRLTPGALDTIGFQAGDQDIQPTMRQAAEVSWYGRALAVTLGKALKRLRLQSRTSGSPVDALTPDAEASEGGGLYR